ncbi:DUF6228 family protein [Nocardia brevicatena]|uniref:DUF6228 family protein n=1 Tax=Nocardia brevicatena TaxID=37327 RepID=UPI001C3F433F|nr:DUF6228 family protein [Nocardia brevicatena]
MTSVAEIVLTDVDPGRSLRIHGYDRHDEDIGAYAVEIAAEALAAAFAITTSNGDGLDRFVRELADDFTGWDGERFWRSMENDLTLTATHHSGGKVWLTWSARRIDYALYQEQWAVSISFPLEAGEQMAGLADELEMFFAAPTETGI